MKQETFTQDLNEEEFILANIEGLMMLAKDSMKEYYTQKSLNILWKYYSECEEFEKHFNKVA